MESTTPAPAPTRDTARQWHLAFLVSFSLLLVVVFAYYLPLRFLHGAEEEDEHPVMEDDHAAADGTTEDARDMESDNVDHDSITHEEGDARSGLAVNLVISPVPVSVNAPAIFDFFVNEKPGDIAVSTSTLEYNHEKLMHVIGARSDLNEFFHIHPEATTTPGHFAVPRIFRRPGRYKIWSEITKDGTSRAYGHPEFDVSGEGQREERNVYFSRSAIVGNYQVLLEYNDSITRNQEAHLSFDIHDLSSREVEVEPYLGADMHLAIIKDDWRQLIHTHPESGENGHSAAPLFLPIARAHGGEAEAAADTDKDKSIEFHVVFPEAGTYRAFVQFRPRGSFLPPEEALNAAFWLRVEEKAPVRVSQPVLVAISLVLIAALGYGVRRFITVR